MGTNLGEMYRLRITWWARVFIFGIGDPKEPAPVSKERPEGSEQPALYLRKWP